VELCSIRKPHRVKSTSSRCLTVLASQREKLICFHGSHFARGCFGYIVLIRGRRSAVREYSRHNPSGLKEKKKGKNREEREKGTRALGEPSGILAGAPAVRRESKCEQIP